MTYREARNYIEETKKYGSVLGLKNITELLNRLSNPQNDLKFIHIAGTNGKGSVLAILSTVLSCAGYKVGRYVSPAIFGYRERIQVDGSDITKEALAGHMEMIKQAADSMAADGLCHPTTFEIETALAFLYFKSVGCGIVVLETGMGGRLDATNVVATTVLAVICSISMDHMGFLGNTLEEIAYNKAGIIKKGSAVVCIRQSPSIRSIMEKQCVLCGSSYVEADPDLAYDIQFGCETQQFSYKSWKNLTLKLAGAYQIANGVLALEALDRLIALGYLISGDAVKQGFLNTRWKGRFSCIRKHPLFIIDGAHNQDAALRLKESIEIYFNDRKIVYIMGVLADKDYNKIAWITAPLASHIFTITPDNERALPASLLAETVSRYNRHVTACDSMKEALDKGYALTGPEDVLIAFGSLSFLKELEDVMNMDCDFADTEKEEIYG